MVSSGDVYLLGRWMVLRGAWYGKVAICYRMCLVKKDEKFLNRKCMNDLCYSRNMSFLADLKFKVKKTRVWYKGILGSKRQGQDSLTTLEERLFRSATRWHRNSHYR